jgi:hypothetical protein
MSIERLSKKCENFFMSDSEELAAAVLFSGMKVPEEGRYLLDAYKKPAPFTGSAYDF